MKINKSYLANTIEGILVILGMIVLVVGLHSLLTKVVGGIDSVNSVPRQGIIFNSQLTMGQ